MKNKPQKTTKRVVGGGRGNVVIFSCICFLLYFVILNISCVIKAALKTDA